MSIDLDLSISSTSNSPSVRPRQRWIDARGRLFAWSCGTQAGGRIEVAGVGVYCFERRSRRVRAFVRPGTEVARVERLYRQVVYPLALQTRGWQVLHASAVATEDGVVGLCGRSGAGKTTLARSWPETTSEPWCDDALAFRIENAGPMSRQLEPSPAGPHERAPAGRGRRLTALIVLEPCDSSPSAREDRAALERLESPAALSATLPHALCLDPEDPGLARELFHRYADLVSACPVYRLRYRQTPRGASDTARRLAARISSSRATPLAASPGPRARP